LQKIAFRKFYFRPSKLLEHFLDLNSLGRVISFVRGAKFVVKQSMKKQAVGVGINTGG
jgi:hypothetical protein